MADGIDAETGAAAAAPGIQTQPSEASQLTAPCSEPFVMVATSDMPPAESDEEADEMVDTLEDLILEAYNNMQIDGEYIFLPGDVAEKLHRVAEQVCITERCIVLIC